MSNEKIDLTPEETLVVCNMTSTGAKLVDAIAEIVSRRKKGGTPASSKEAKKPSTKDRKEALAKQIEALNGEAPAANASIAKFEEALTTAKAKDAETTSDEATELM